MNIDFIDLFKDIIKYPHNYFTELCMESDNSYLLFNYGPYVANHMPNAYLNYPEDKSTLSFKNDLFRLMYETALLIKATNNNSLTYKESKDKCLLIITRNNSNPYKYSDKVIEIARSLIDSIRKTQIEEKSLESAMLNYAPIVPYIGTIVKPDMEHHVSIDNIDKDKLDKDIEDCLVNNILVIMYNDTKFINVDDMVNSVRNGNDAYIPYDIAKISSNNDIASNYFMMVFLKYIGFNDEYNFSKDDFIKLNMLYNKINKGEKVNIHDVLETFSKLALPS